MPILTLYGVAFACASTFRSKGGRSGYHGRCRERYSQTPNLPSLRIAAVFLALCHENSEMYLFRMQFSFDAFE